MNIEEKEKNNRLELQKTFVPSLKEIERRWFFLDIENEKIGKVAKKIAYLLRGKNREDFIPNSDLGNFVVVVKSRFIKIKSKSKKIYYDHSGYPGGLKEKSYKEMIEKYPERLVRRIIWGMLPKNKLSHKQMKRLFIYRDNHNLKAQQKYFEIIDKNEK